MVRVVTNFSIQWYDCLPDSIPCAILFMPVTYYFMTEKCPSLSPSPILPIPPTTSPMTPTSLFSVFMSVCFFLDPTYKWNHKMCHSLSDLFQCAQCPLSPSMLPQRALACISLRSLLWSWITGWAPRPVLGTFFAASLCTFTKLNSIFSWDDSFPNYTVSTRRHSHWTLKYKSLIQGQIY